MKTGVTKVIFFSALEVCDAANGTHSGTYAAPFAEPLVLPRPNEVHASPVVRVLIEQPISFGNVAGEDVIPVETIHDAGTVVHEVHHLTAEL